MSNTKRTANPTLSTDTMTRLAELTERSKQLAIETERLQQAITLEQNVRLARGTKRDIQGITQPTAPAQPRPMLVTDVASSPLYAKVRELVTTRPLTLRELIEQTKAEENKVKVVLMRMQRDEIGLMNMGNRYRALWFIPSEAFRKQFAAKQD